MDNIALKEWAVAVRAMEAGRQDVIFRKGGIHEPRGDFQPDYTAFYLYPAREHQKAQYLKLEFLPLLQQVQQEENGNLVDIRCRATVLEVIPIHTMEQATPFQHRHIWTPEFIQMRLDYKPHRPLYAMILKMELLDSAITFTETTQQAGCKSWVTVENSASRQSHP